MADVLLQIENISRAFGGLMALDNVSFAVSQGQIKAVIGPNGAGKTTLFNIISGVIPPTTGEILFKGRTISGLPPYRIGEHGISRTFQNLSLFENMTVLENVMVGAHCRTNGGILSSVLRLPHHFRQERLIYDAAMRHLENVGLAEKASQAVSALSFGQRRLVELARALATEPLMLLLDEPASGLNTKETDDLGKIIRKIRDSGITILLVEHDMTLVMDISDSIFVLNYGRPVTEGTPEAVRNDQNVVAIYLGGDLENAPH